MAWCWLGVEAELGSDPLTVAASSADEPVAWRWLGLEAALGSVWVCAVATVAAPAANNAAAVTVEKAFMLISLAVFDGLLQ
jgi:hypothetical protein